MTIKIEAAAQPTQDDTKQQTTATQATTQGETKLVPGTPEYDAEMVRIAKAARGEEDDPSQTDNPSSAKSPDADSELILGKFKSQDDLVKAYQELEKKLGGGKPEGQQEAPKDEPKPEGDQKIAGVPVSELETEVKSNGDLTPETREKLTKAGIPAEYIDSYLAMYKVAAQAEAQAVQAAEAEIKQAVGGDEAYSAIVQWAASSLTPGEIDAFNRQIESGRDAAMLAVMGLKARYESKLGKSPRLVGGTPGGGTDVFSDKAAFLEAMGDPRYKSSESYRNQVTQKLARTRDSGIYW